MYIYIYLINLIYIFTCIAHIACSQTAPATVAGAYSPGTRGSCRALRVVPLAKVRSPRVWVDGQLGISQANHGNIYIYIWKYPSVSDNVMTF